MKKIIPTNCPVCDSKLVIEQGKKDDVIKLTCKNPECIGTAIKKLEKGIIALEIDGIGPKLVEKLYFAGIKNSYDLFNKSIFNKSNLINSGEFKDGKSLDKLINSISSIKEINIEKVLLSLQLENIGKTFSYKIAQLFSGIMPDMTGLLINIREELKDTNSKLYLTIENSLKKFENNGIIIKKIEVKQNNNTNIKLIIKKYDSTINNIEDIISKLNWIKISIKDDNCELLIIKEKNEEDEKIKIAKKLNKKILTLKQVELLFF
jgi:NAD-dependent DNA ligase